MLIKHEIIKNMKSHENITEKYSFKKTRQEQQK